MALANVNTNGQNFANANGTCCCYVADPTCDGCNYLGNRERNTCDNSYRNTTPTEYNSCNCGAGCQGTNYNYTECQSVYGEGNRDRRYFERYNCYPYSFVPNSSYVTQCGCDAGSQEIASQNYYTCVGCTTFEVFRDGNRCSGTGGQYFVNGSSVGGSPPSNGSCNTNSSYGISRGVRCFNGTNYNVYEDSNGCGGGEQFHLHRQQYRKPYIPD